MYCIYTCIREYADTISLMLFSLFVTGFKRECLMVNWFRLKTLRTAQNSIYAAIATMIL